MNNMKAWIISICNSDGDGIDMFRFYGTYGDCKRIIQKEIRTIKENEADDYEYNTLDVAKDKSDICGCVVCSDHHIDVQARLLNNLSFIDK